MTELERLRAHFSRGTLLSPNSDVENLVDFAGVLAAAGGLLPEAPTDGGRRLASTIGPADHLVFVLVDGLGLAQFDDLPPEGFLRTHLVREMRTVYPSSTACALTTLATGLWPAQHAITGWWTYLPRLNAACAPLPFVTQGTSDAASKPLTEVGVMPEDLFPEPSRLSRLVRDTAAFIPVKILGSVYSHYFMGERPSTGYRTLSEASDAIVERVASAKTPTFTYFYFSQADEEAHRYGAHHPVLRQTLLELDQELGRLAQRLSGRARLVITADHGALDIPRNGNHNIAAATDLWPMLRNVPSGDARVFYFHVKPDDVDTFARRFLNRYGEAFMLLTVAEAEAEHLLGPQPLSPTTAERVGDFVAIATGADIMDYLPTIGAPRLARMASHHSGLTPDEMRIPLVVA